GKGRRDHGGGRQDWQHRRREDLRSPRGIGGAHPHGRARRERALRRGGLGAERKGGLTVKRFILALAVLLVLGATMNAAIAQQPTPPAAESSAPAAAAPAPAVPPAPPPPEIHQGRTPRMVT